MTDGEKDRELIKLYHDDYWSLVKCKYNNASISRALKKTYPDIKLIYNLRSGRLAYKLHDHIYFDEDIK